MSIRAEITKIVKQSHLECGLPIACNTTCEKCGTERIKLVITEWLNAHASKVQLEQFEKDWE